MSQTKQILLAFLIPLVLAIGLLFLRFLVFYDPYDPWIRPANVAPPHEEYVLPEQLEIIGLLIVGSLILSFVLPPFVMMRMYQSRKFQLKSKSITE
ncbi:MAG TPA: hypothetical protein VIL74_05490 [Pyrinomonadaceae bacterium]|jgi:capsular polysaccharide biosynthesis protein